MVTISAKMKRIKAQEVRKQLADQFAIISKSSTHPYLSPGESLVPHLTADAESLQRVEAEPASVSCLSEAVHELCVKRPLQRRQTHQDHMLLLGGQLVPQHVMTSPGMIFMKCW